MARFETEGGDPEVLAAGGVVVRDDGDGPKALVIHRPKYKDWSLPKGKLDPGESFEQAAVREVMEETGFTTELLEPLGEISYRDRKARPKLVRYWLMEAAGRRVRAQRRGRRGALGRRSRRPRRCSTTSATQSSFARHSRDSSDPAADRLRPSKRATHSRPT